MAPRRHDAGHPNTPTPHPCRRVDGWALPVECGTLPPHAFPVSRPGAAPPVHDATFVPFGRGVAGSEGEARPRLHGRRRMVNGPTSTAAATVAR